jgi:2EXR family
MSRIIEDREYMGQSEHDLQRIQKDGPQKSEVEVAATCRSLDPSQAVDGKSIHEEPINHEESIDHEESIHEESIHEEPIDHEESIHAESINGEESINDEEPSYYEESIDEDLIYVGLQLTSLFSSWMKHDFGHRTTESKPLQKCLLPVSLHVCRKSRAITLQRFVKMVDIRSPSRSFYFNPHLDVLCLSRDIIEEGVGEVAEVGCCYGAQINLIQSCY